MIRLATKADIPAIVSMGERFHGASAWSERRYDKLGAEVTASRLIIDKRSVIFITDKGMIGGSISQVPFLSIIMAQEAFWWAERGHGLALLRRFEGWAKDMSAEFVCMISLAGDERAEALYQRLGYAKTETMHFKAL